MRLDSHGNPLIAIVVMDLGIGTGPSAFEQNLRRHLLEASGLGTWHEQIPLQGWGCNLMGKMLALYAGHPGLHPRYHMHKTQQEEHARIPSTLL